MSAPEKRDWTNKQVKVLGMVFTGILLLITLISIPISISDSKSAYEKGFADATERTTTIVTETFHRQAIVEGFAQFDPTTGLWRWKTSKELNLLSYLDNGGPDINTFTATNSLLPEEILPSKKRK